MTTVMDTCVLFKKEFIEYKEKTKMY
jgi:hypothetical protein